jgi:alkylation response protein AidB-like acyl-CoA dehydrogenase
MSYIAPVKDMLFCMKELADLEAVARLPGFEDAGIETAQAVLEECARFSGEVLAPLNRDGDVHPSSWQAGVVTTTPGFKEAFRHFGEGGWQGLQHPADFGGQGLPKTIGAACIEMINSANLSFALCPLLTDGAIEALLTAGTRAQQEAFIPKMISGEWTGTMNLTEPQAGSDLALVRTRAEPLGDGRFRIFGTKIFITYGEHDMAENIVHLVLARVVGAPEGVKGISLFIVPKFLVNADGSLGARNDAWCVSIEHKLGIKASPTAVLQFGDRGIAGLDGPGGDRSAPVPGALGALIGAENRGLEYMFIMMNAARYAVGMQGIAVAERAYQKAAAFAKERVQSRPVDGSVAGSATIIHHPDVRRMLMTMRAYTEGCRAMAIVAAAAFDAAHHDDDEAVRKENQAFYEFLVPLVKGYSTEMSIEVASLGIQVHGGMGFIEETGAAQYLRDARILTIYEGTTAIQANDLVGRKTARDGGRVAKAVAAQVAATEGDLGASTSAAARSMLKRLHAARTAFEQVVAYVVEEGKAQPNAVFAGSVPYLMLAGNLVAGWQMARALLAAERLLAAHEGDAAFLAAKVATARFYAEHLLSKAPGQRDAIVEGAESVTALALDAF